MRPPERGHLMATCPGQTLGPGTAESPFPALTRPASRPQATDRHQRSSLSMASRLGLSSPRPARQRSPQSQGAVIHTHSTNKPHSATASLCPPTTRAGDARQPSLPTPDRNLSPCPPPRHTHPGGKGPSSQQVSATDETPAPASALPSRTPALGHTLGARGPRHLGTPALRKPCRHQPPQEPFQAIVLIALLA